MDLWERFFIGCQCVRRTIGCRGFYGWLGNTIEWLNKDCPVSPSEFAEMQFKMLPEVLQKAFHSYIADSDDFGLMGDM